MSNVLWPQVHGLAWTLKRTTAFKTAIQPAVANGYETRLQLGGPDPILKFELAYAILQGQNELSQIEAFFWDRGGSYDSFLLDAGAITKNPAESFVADQTLTMDINNNAPLVRTKPHTQSSEAIYELALDDQGNRTKPVIRKNDTVLNPNASPPDYVLHTPAEVATGLLNAQGITYAGYVAHFGVSTAGSRISADFGWLYRMRFAQDEQEFDMFHYLLWEAKQVQLMGTRAPLAT